MSYADVKYLPQSERKGTEAHKLLFVYEFRTLKVSSVQSESPERVRKCLFGVESLITSYCCKPGYRTADLSTPVVVQSRTVTIKLGVF